MSAGTVTPKVKITPIETETIEGGETLENLEIKLTDTLRLWGVALCKAFLSECYDSQRVHYQKLEETVKKIEGLQGILQLNKELELKIVNQEAFIKKLKQNYDELYSKIQISESQQLQITNSTTHTLTLLKTTIDKNYTELNNELLRINQNSEDHKPRVEDIQESLSTWKTEFKKRQDERCGKIQTSLLTLEEELHKANQKIQELENKKHNSSLLSQFWDKFRTT